METASDLSKQKKSYVAPKLVTLGDVRVVTQDKTTGFNDVGPFQSQIPGGS